MLQMLDKPGVLIVGLLMILVFGAKRLPEAARSLGKSARILKAETRGLHDDAKTADTPVHNVTSLHE
jgi:sec-independent protein translocase protein TatA